MTGVQEAELIEATKVIAKEAEPEVTVLETVEFSDGYTSATKTIYSNESADYDIWAKIPYCNASVHYKICNMPTNGEASGLKNVSIVTFANETENTVRIKIWAYEDIASCQIDLKNMTDTQLGTLDEKIRTYQP